MIIKILNNIAKLYAVTSKSWPEILLYRYLQPTPYCDTMNCTLAILIWSNDFVMNLCQKWTVAFQRQRWSVVWTNSVCRAFGTRKGNHGVSWSVSISGCSEYIVIALIININNYNVQCVWNHFDAYTYTY